MPKRKNKEGKAFLRNFTEDYINRIILADKDLINKPSLIDDATMRDKLSKITEDVNFYIQKLNMKVDRNIPYISLRFSIEFSEDTRIFMRNKAGNFDIKLQIDESMDTFLNISHMLDLYIVAGGKEMYVSEMDDINGMIAADPNYKGIAIIDIFLDIALFNSYSFLKRLSKPEKKKFSKLKADYYRKNGLDSFFINEENVDLDYYSFAFACHTIDKDGNEIFDFDKYISIWNDFLNQYYPNRIHEEYSIEQQIEMRVDNHIPKNYYKKFDSLPAGIYFILRINKKDIPIKRKESVNNIFKTKNSKVGDLVIVNQTEAINYFDVYSELFTELYIAPFKIVKQ